MNLEHSKTTVTADEVHEARNADLFDFLLSTHADDFTKDSKRSIRFKLDRSICITEGTSFYYDYETGEYGNAIEFLTSYMGYGFVEAVQTLCGYEIAPILQPDRAKAAPVPAAKEPFGMPQRAEKSNRLYAYLTETRGIDGDTVRELLDAGLIYQDVRGNVVFTNKQRTWAELRGTCDFAEMHCQHEKSCEKCFTIRQGYHCINWEDCADYKKTKGFHGLAKSSEYGGYWAIEFSEKPDTVYVCEAGIDAVSLYELQGCRHDRAYASIGGVGKQAAIEKLKEDYAEVILAVDCDEAGEACRKRNPELKYILPESKDWNEDLQRSKEIDEREDR